MARPQKNTVDYFPFYVEEGKKMYYIEETYGNEGFAVFVKLLRELARTEYHYLDLSNKATKMFLAAKCKVSIEFMETLIKDLVDLGKFNRELWEENSIIWCQDFVDSIQDAYEKRKNKCVNISSLLVLLESLGVRKQSKLPLKGGRNTQTILEETKEEEIYLSGKPDYAHIFKGWVKFINQTFDRQFTTAAWEKKTLHKIKQLLKDYKTKENLAEALITVCKNIAKDAYHIETNFKYVTPEYIARPDIFDKHLNTISKVDSKKSERWQKPEDIYLCVDWIDKIPCPPKDLNGDEAAMFMYVWRISELMHYQQDRQGVHSNLSEHAEF